VVRFEPAEAAKPGTSHPSPAADTALVKGLLDICRDCGDDGLVFVENRSLHKVNPAFQAVPAEQKTAYVKEFTPPEAGELSAGSSDG